MQLLKSFSYKEVMKRENSFLLIPLLLYLPFIFLGYGADSDSYEVLRTGRTFVETLDYIPSRNPGYVVFEIITYFADLIGGSIATNLVSVGMALIALLALYKISRALSIPNSKYLVFGVSLHPYFWVAATTTMDYVSALGFSLAGLFFLSKRKVLSAGILFGFAVGCRLTTVLLVFIGPVIFTLAGIILFKDALKSLLIAGILSPVFYLPPLDFVEWRWWRVFAPVMGADEHWTLFLRTGRFFYKNIVFWSIPVLLFLFIILFRFVRMKRDLEPKSIKLVVMLLIIILAYEALFFFVPLDPSYLLPTLPFVFMVVWIIFGKHKKQIMILLVLVFLSNFLVVNIAKPNVENSATGARYGVWLESGYLVSATENRIKVMDCRDQSCYREYKNR